MRRYISYILSAVAAVLMSSCIDIAINPVEPQSPAKVTLQLTNSDLVATRAYTDDDQNNEDLIKSVQCFFAATGSDAVTFATDLINVNKPSTETLDIEMPAEYIETLFNNTDQCDVYVLANYGRKLELTSIEDIEDLDINLAETSVQPSFVMTGKSYVTLSGTSLLGTVSLVRTAAKIVVKLNMNESIVEGGVTWTPDAAAIAMSYKGSVNGSKVSAEAVDAVFTNKVTYSQARTETTTVFAQDDTESTSDLYVGYQTMPFYSFPVSQADNSGEISIVIPWKPNGGEAVNYKYQIPIDIEFVRNNAYLIEVNVGVLGSINGTKLTPSYTVVNWTDEPFDAGLVRPKYLVVEEKEIELFNESSYSIPYASSDDVTVIVDSISFESYRYATTRKVQITSSSVSIKPSASLTVNDKYNDYTVVKVEEEGTNNGVANFNHAILSTTFVPQKIYITIRHTSDANYAEQVVITQYPPIYLKSDHSNGKVFVNTQTFTQNNQSSYYGYSSVYDDNDNGIGTVSQPSGITGSDEGTNVNQNMYNVYITSLPNTNPNLIGDPRINEGNSLDGINNLKSYRSTKQSAINIIAPAFKIASSYGKTTTMSYNAAVKRCASYQEDGYPAGRWRIPTQAEIEFMQNRVLNGDIPSLFNGIYSTRNGRWQYSTGYWSADGMVYWPDYDADGDKLNWNDPGFYSTDDMGTTSQSVRCVYDIWYWGEDQYPGAAQTATWAD